MNTAISNISTNGTNGVKVITNTMTEQHAKKNRPKLKLGFRMADAVILLSLRKVVG